MRLAVPVNPLSDLPDDSGQLSACEGVLSMPLLLSLVIIVLVGFAAAVVGVGGPAGRAGNFDLLNVRHDTRSPNNSEVGLVSAPLVKTLHVHPIRVDRHT